MTPPEWRAGTTPEKETEMPKVPRGMYDPDRHGLLDPERLTVSERALQDPEYVLAERDRAASLSPVVRRLASVTARALGRTR